MNEQKIRRDEHSGAVLSVDHEGLRAYKKRRAQNTKMATLESDINILKQDISEIKDLLQQILIRG